MPPNFSLHFVGVPHEKPGVPPIKFRMELRDARQEVKAAYTVPLPYVRGAEIRFRNQSKLWSYLEAFPPGNNFGNELLSRFVRVMERLSFDTGKRVIHLGKVPSARLMRKFEKFGYAERSDLKTEGYAVLESNFVPKGQELAADERAVLERLLKHIHGLQK
ncbi:MAG: hypothetical protein V1787_01870 [Candidatus Micrarchaeota archaeon]